MNTKISVIIPTFNVENFIDKTINSVINQTIGFENIELIIVDDNSTDNTRLIIKNYSKKYANIIPIFLEKNTGGPSTPRNIGIKSAKSNYILFLDHDDFFHHDLCEKLFEFIEIVNDENIDFLIFGYQKEFSNNKLIKFPINSEDSFNIYNDYNKVPGDMFFIWNKMFKKSFLQKFSIEFPNSLAEDLNFMAQVFIVTKKYMVLNNYIGYTWNIHSNSVTSSGKYRLKLMRGILSVYNLLKKNDKLELFPKEQFFAVYINFLSLDMDFNMKKKIFQEFELFFKENLLFDSYNVFLYLFFRIFALNYRFAIAFSYIYKLFQVPRISLKNKQRFYDLISRIFIK